MADEVGPESRESVNGSVLRKFAATGTPRWKSESRRHLESSLTFLIY